MVISRLLQAAVLALAVLAAGPAAAAAQRIAAIVNDEVITTEDLNGRVAMVAASGGIPDDARTRQQLMQQVLRGYIDEKLQLQEGERLKMSASEAEVDRALATIAERNRMGLDAFRQALKERNIDEAVLRQQIRGQIIWAKVVSRELRPRVAVTQDQVDLALRELESASQDAELNLAEIVLPVDGPEQQPQVLREARALVQSLRGGADFSALARQVSITSSAKDGGDLGWIRPVMLLPQLRDALAKLPEGGISDPLPSPVGVHIFQLRERRDRNTPREEPKKRLVVQRVSLAQVILPLPADAKEADIKAAEKQAAALAPKLKSCKAIDAYAERTDSSGSGSIGWLKVADLPDVLQQLVTRLEPQQISPPFRGPLGVQLLMVCDREGREETIAAPPPPPPPAPPSAEEMRARLEDEQLQRLANRYLRELRRDAFIDVRMGA